MAEMLVRARDKPMSGDPYTDVQRTGAGDVIVIVPDGWAWSQEELTHPRWVIVKVPGASIADLQPFVQTDPGFGTFEALVVSRMLRRRSFGFDLNALLGGPKDSQVRQAPVTLNNLAQALALGGARAIIADPNVIG